MKRSDLWTRRLVLQRAVQLGAMGVATPLAINLAAIGEAAAFDNTDYKALVCVFLYGGNDYANTVVPYDAANYALYHQIRAGGPGEDQAGIALARASLAATALTPQGGQVLTDNLQYALAPQLAGLKQIWDAGRLAVQLNEKTMASTPFRLRGGETRLLRVHLSRKQRRTLHRAGVLYLKAAAFDAAGNRLVRVLSFQL